MAMLGGECSKCCGAGGVKCYVPGSDYGSCCWQSDGSCRLARECECTDPSGEFVLFTPEAECGHCVRYCRDFGSARGCALINTQESPLPPPSVNPKFIEEGQPCSCCPQANPEQNPFFSSIRNLGLDGFNRVVLEEECGCCAESPAGREISTEYPASITVSITGTNIYLDGDYELPLDRSAVISASGRITTHCAVYRKGAYEYANSSGPGNSVANSVLKWSQTFPDRPCSFHTYSPAGVDICVEGSPENNRFALLGMSATLGGVSLRFQYFGRVWRTSTARCSCGLIAPFGATGPIPANGDWLCGTGPQTASGTLVIHPECKDYSEATDGQFTVTVNPLP